MIDRTEKMTPNHTGSLSLPKPIQELTPGEGAEVEQSSWGAFRSTEADVTTGGLGPCCGIVVFDSNSKIAAVGHFVCLDVENSLVDEMIDFIKTTATDRKALSVTIAGLSPMEDNARPAAEAERLRRSIVERFTELGVPAESIQTAWAAEDTVVSVDIHLDSGAVEIASYDLPLDPDLFI